MNKLVKQTLLTLGLAGLIANSVWAMNADFDVSVTPIANNVYSIISPSYGLPTAENKGWNSNSHFVVTDDGVLVFDSGSSETIGKAIKRAIQSVTDKPVRWVVNSHSHADHWLGNAGFVGTNPEIIASNSVVRTMKTYGEQDVAAFSRMTKGATGSTRIVYPTLSLVQGEKRSLGGLDVEFIFSNDAHSPGDVLMWLPKQRIIFGGDVLNSDWMPIITPDANIPSLIDTLYAVAKLTPAVVLPGHGRATTATSVRRDADLLNRVWQLVKEGYADGQPRDALLVRIRTELTAEYSPLYNNFDAQIGEYVTQMVKRQSR